MDQDLTVAATLEAVSKSLGRKPVLNRLDHVIRADEVTALLGPNGAGKSTTVGLLTGRLCPDAGAVRIYGLTPERPAARARMGVMLQAAGLVVNTVTSASIASAELAPISPNSAEPTTPVW